MGGETRITSPPNLVCIPSKTELERSPARVDSCACGRTVVMRLSRTAIAVLLALVSTHVLAQEKTGAKSIKAVRFGKLWDAKGKVWTNAIVVIENGKVRAVTTDASAIPAGTETIDLSKYTGLPGLIDAHTHMTFYTDETPGVPLLKQMANPVPAVEVFLARKGALRTLEAGVTTVRDLGSDQYIDIAMRDLINHGEMIGPRMFVCGYGLTVTSTPYKPGLNLPAGGIADGAPDALRAGTDSLEHATDMDDATIQEMARRGTFYVPTIDHNRYYLDNWQQIGYANGFQEKTKAFIERNLETARKAHKAGVKFAMGSDAIYTMFGENTRELGWFVKAGMTPEQALRTATTNAAELLGKEKELGAVAPGYFADLVAVEGDPLADIDVAIYKVKWVMKAGAVVADKTKAQPR